MGNRRKNSINRLASDILKFEDKQKAVKKTDFTDLQTFLSAYLNTPDTKQRKRIAAEFQKRHMELYQFMKDNPELLKAETEMASMLQAVASGSAEEADSKEITNLFEKLQEGLL